MSKKVKRSSGEKKESNGFIMFASANRGLVLLIVMVLATVGWATLSNRPVVPILSTALPTGTPPTLPANAPARDYIYAGSSLISTVEPFREPPNDLAVWRPSDGIWYILNSQQQAVYYPWGISTDIPAPGDFDGDGKTDFCVFRASNGTWYIVYSSNGSIQYASYGMSDDKPVPADFDGDGRSDVALWRPSNQTWYINRSSDGGNTEVQFGASGDAPTPADFDGDGKTDVAIWRDSTHSFWVSRSSDGQPTSFSIGATGDQPVVGDYS